MSKKPTMQNDMVVRKNKKPFFIAGGVLAVVLVLVIGFFVLKSLQVVATPALRVGEVEVSQADFDEYVELGEARGMSKGEVRGIVVEYEKNLQMAEQFNIDIPKEYVRYVVSREESLDESLMDADDVSPRSDRLSVALDYNKIFDNRVSQSVQPGYGVFVYELGIKSGDDAAISQAKKTLAEYRDRIPEDGAAQVLTDLIRHSAKHGQMVYSDFSFIADGEYPYYDESERYVRSPAYLLSLLKDPSQDSAEIRETDSGSVFFMYELFESTGGESLVADISNAKEGMRVVIYDR